tara:strand:+ start:419 stop:1132 length:714 start_codon:yes stop_codon:yes gene_type:complete
MKNLLLLLLSLNIYTQTIESYFKTPEDYKRTIQSNYHNWIISRKINTKDKVKYYDGESIKGLNVYYKAKFVYDIGKKDLHHCADAVMYNDARYFFDTKQYKKISYTFSHNAKVYSYTKQFKVFNEKTFKKYITMVWGYAGTWSLKQYDTVEINIRQMQVGDMFLIGGFPGHAMSVIDMIENDKGSKKFMLAQSFMPAQEQHILLNPNTNNVWFNSVSEIPWNFSNKDLRRFKHGKYE